MVEFHMGQCEGYWNNQGLRDTSSNSRSEHNNYY